MNRPETNAPKPVRSWLAPLGLFLLTFLLFSPVRNHEFINYDDQLYMTESPLVLEGLKADRVREAFTSHHAYMWHPLTTISHQLDVTLFGLDGGAHLLMNAFYHGLAAALLFILLRSLTGTHWRALVVTALFAWHPLRVESVAWVSERKDVLYGVFWMLTLLAYRRYTAMPSRQNYALLFAAFAFGILTKPLIVTLPCVLLLLDIWPLNRWPMESFDSRQAWRHHWRTVLKLFTEKVPLFVLSGVLSVMTWKMQSFGGIIRTTDQFTITERVTNAMVSYVRYLGKLAWPQDLVVFYPHPGQWPWPMVTAAGLALVAISAWVLRRRRTHPWELVGWLWFLGSLVPAIGIVQAGGQSMADRYTYVACIGILVGVVWSGERLSREKGWRNAGLILTVLLPLLAYIWLTRVQLSYWQNSETLFRHVLAASPGNVVGYENLGSALIARGKMEEAVMVLQDGLEAHPGRPNLHNSLGLAYRALGQNRAAIEQYRLALLSKPNFGAARNNLGNLLRETGDASGAIRELEEALKHEPQDSETMNNLGLAYEDAGRKSEALHLYENAIATNPRNAEAHVNLGVLLMELGRREEAMTMCRRAVVLRPEFIEAQFALFYALAESGKRGEALEAASRVTQLAQQQNRADILRLLESEMQRRAFSP